jgi:toxin-antitoxin system PIN domain toxin
MIVDANLLLYAVDSTSSHHRKASAWLEQVMSGPQRIGLPWQTIGAFLRIITHPRVTADPLNSATAWDFVRDWLDQPQVWIPPAGERTAEILAGLLAEGVTGNLIPDAQLAALAIEHGVPVASNDSDFARFPACRWFNPLA